MLKGRCGPDGVTTGPARPEGQQRDICRRGARQSSCSESGRLVPTSLPHGSSPSGSESFQKCLQKLSVSPVFLDFPGLLSICSKSLVRTNGVKCDEVRCNLILLKAGLCLQVLPPHSLPGLF